MEATYQDETFRVNQIKIPGVRGCLAMWLIILRQHRDNELARISSIWKTCLTDQLGRLLGYVSPCRATCSSWLALLRRAGAEITLHCCTTYYGAKGEVLRVVSCHAKAA